MVGNSTADSDIICCGVVLRSYALVLEDREWNWAHTAINYAGLLFRREDFMWTACWW